MNKQDDHHDHCHDHSHKYERQLYFIGLIAYLIARLLPLSEWIANLLDI